MLVDRRVISAGDQRIGRQHVTITELPGHTQRVLPLGRRIKIGVQVDDLKVAAIAGGHLFRLLARHAPAGATGRRCRFAVHPILREQVDTADLCLYRRGIGVGEYVRVPDVGVTAREQTDAAANRDRIGRIPGETEAGQNQVEVIQRRVVGKAIISDEIRIKVRLITRLVPVVAQSNGQLQPVGNLPLVLNIRRIHGVAPVHGCISLVVGDGVAVIDPRGLTRRKILDAIKTNFSINVLIEQVVHLEIFAFETPGDRVIT